jgi:PAS domain S-box-containing protein
MDKAIIHNGLELADSSWLIDELSRLERVSAKLDDRRALADTLEEILRAMSEAIGSQMNTLCLRDDAIGQLVLSASTRLPADFLSAIFPQPVSPQSPCCGRAVSARDIAIIEDMRDDPLWEPFLEASERASLRSVWSIPILDARGRALGAFASYYAEAYSPARQEIDLARVYARHAAIAIENARLYDESERDRSRLRSILDHIPSGIFIARAPDGELLMMNRAGIELVGRMPEARTLKDYYAGTRLHNADGSEVPADERPLASALRGQSIRDREYSYTGPDGVPRHFLVSAVPLRYEDGEIFAGMLIFTDNTERREAQEALRALEERFFLAFNSSPQSMVITTLEEGRYIEVNESYLRLTGYSREEVIGRRSTDLNVWVNPEERAAVVETLKREGRARNIEIRFRKRSGEEMVMLFSAELITLNDERCLLTATTDITERKRAEEALRASEERFAIAFSATPDPVTISTLSEERYLDVNEAFLRITGYAREEIVGRAASETGFWVNWQDRDLVTQALRKNRRVRNLEIKYRAKSGKTRTALLSAQIIDLDGRECALAVYNDITEREKAARIQAAVYRISEAANSAENLQALFRSIHEIVGELLPAQNFYIALYDSASEEVSFPYFVDERDPPPQPRKFGKGLTEHVIRSGRPVQVVPERLRHLVEEGKAELIGAHSSDWFGVPLKAQDKTIGALVLQSYNEDLRFDEEEKNILVFVSTQVAMAIERKRAEEQLRQRVDQLQTIYHLSDALSRAEDVEEIYEESLNAFERALKVSRSSLLLFDTDGVIRFKAWHGLSEEYRREVEGHSTWPGEEKNAHPVFIPDVREAPDLRELSAAICDEGIRALGIIPLVYQTRLLGKFMLYYDNPHRFTAEESQLAQTIASHVAFAIERKRSEEALRASEERFSKAFNLSPNAMVLHNLRDGRIVAANDIYLRAVGYSREEVLGRTSEELTMWPEPDREAFLQLLRERREIRDYEINFFTRAGEARRGLLSAEVIELGGEKFVLIGVYDVTERIKADAALRASEERFSKAFHASPNPMTINRFRDGLYIDVNEAAVQASGYAREEMIGHTADELGIWVNRQERDKILRLLRRHRLIRNLETCYVTKSGDVRVVLVSAEIIDLDGEKCLLSTTSDITERKRAEEALRASEERFSKAFHASPDSMSIATLDEGRYIDVNEAFLRLNKLTREEVIGHTAVELALWARPEDRARMVDELRRHGRVHEMEMEARTRDGEKRVLLLSGEVIEIGGELCALTTGNDITERKRAEQERDELLAREQRAREEAERERVTLNAAIEQMGEGLMIFDPAGRVVRANEQALKIFGYSLEEITSGSPETLAAGRFSDEDGNTIPVSDLPIQVALREKRIIERRLWYIRPDGRRVLLTHTASPFFSERNLLAGAIALARDITEREREHERLQQADKLRALGQLASGVAHNFNNALAAILGYTQLSLQKAASAEVEKNLQIIERSARDAARMVERIHNFSRGGSAREDFIPLPLIEILRDAIDMTRPRWRDDAEALGIKYEVTLDWQAEESLMVNGEPSELREVFINILLNALDAMPAGGEISLRASRDQSRAVVKIADTGSGMTEEVKRRIFEPFFTTKGMLGLGMGLSEGYRIVERHGGRIEVESQTGQGTVFTVSLPVIQSRAIEATVEEEFSPPAAARILVIDDEVNVRSVLAEMLARQGHEVLEASSSEEGLRLVDEQSFDVVFTDLAMPKVDGIATATRIKARHPAMKVVLMSGYGADKIQELIGDSLIIDAAITKPFRLAALQKILSRVMRKA